MEILRVKIKFGEERLVYRPDINTRLICNLILTGSSQEL